MQAAQGFRAYMRQPAQQRPATAVFQDLLGGPQGIKRALGRHPEQLTWIQAPALPAGQVRDVRRLHQGDGVTAVELGQRGLQQADFPNAGVWHE